eukprot:XP_017948548.1 PREDICTED: E3 ubiquitin-protein ligase znrf1 isoform X1 [Xenopus tropicalis]
MGGKQSSASRSRAPFPGVSSDDSAVPPSSNFGHFRAGGAMGLRSRSVSSVSGLDPPAPGLPFGLYRAGPDTERGGSSGSEDSRGDLYLGSRASLADTLQIAPRWIGAHSAHLPAHIYGAAIFPIRVAGIPRNLLTEKSANHSTAHAPTAGFFGKGSRKEEALRSSYPGLVLFSPNRGTSPGYKVSD